MQQIKLTGSQGMLIKKTDLLLAMAQRNASELSKEAGELMQKATAIVNNANAQRREAVDVVAQEHGVEIPKKGLEVDVTREGEVYFRWPDPVVPVDPTADVECRSCDWKGNVEDLAESAPTDPMGWMRCPECGSTRNKVNEDSTPAPVGGA